MCWSSPCSSLTSNLTSPHHVTFPPPPPGKIRVVWCCSQHRIRMPHPGKLALEAVAHPSDNCPAQELPSWDVLSQKPRESMKKRDEGGEREQSDSDDDQEDGILFIREESEHEWQSPYQDISDVKEEEGTPLVVPECSSQCHSVDGSLDKKSHASPSWGRKSRQKMNHARQWVVDFLLPVSTSVSMVSLEDIAKSYFDDCYRKGQEALTTFVLARLIHKEFPEAGKCRRGPRGNQKIHYRKLQWKVSLSPNQHHTNVTASTAGETPSEDFPLTEAQNEGKKPPSSLRSWDVVQDPRPGKNNEMLLAAKEAIERADLQPIPEDDDDDQEGCQDAASRFSQVVKSVKMQGKLDVLLKIFAHSASCNKSPCYPLCLMFRRVRRHVVNARHACYVMRIYSVLLKLHVARCDDNNCGMTACPALRASRQMKRGRDDELQKEEAQLDQQQDEPQHKTKRLSGQAKRPSSLRIRIPSPASSLPDSQPSTPSPGVSPSHTMPPSPVRIVPLMPLEMGRVAKIHTVRGGA